MSINFRAACGLAAGCLALVALPVHASVSPSQTYDYAGFSCFQAGTGGATVNSTIFGSGGGTECAFTIGNADTSFGTATVDVSDRSGKTIGVGYDFLDQNGDDLGSGSQCGSGDIPIPTGAVTLKVDLSWTATPVTARVDCGGQATSGTVTVNLS
ncbi:MAG: hypothetical protein ACYDAY_05105 [Candidatus Dormibacteria bacterium]